MGRKILFITTDQQRYDSLGCNGGTVARTPVADRLAAEGVNYSRAYNQNTVCMPARSSMLTGQYVRTHGVVANGIPLPVDAPSIAAHLADTGDYRTALLGKAHFEPNMPIAGYQENDLAAAGSTGPMRGFDHVELALHVPLGYGTPIQHYGRWLAENHPDETGGFAAILEARGGGDTGAPETAINPVPREHYHTDWVAERTIAYLDSLSSDEDWFVWMSFPDPHHPWDPPASELRRVNWRDLDLPPGHPGSPDAIRKVLAEKPGHWLGYYDGSWTNIEGGAPAFQPSEMTDDQLREVTAMVHIENELIDEACGRVLDRVAERGWAEDTDVFFTTDHGELQGDYGLLFKGPFHVDSLMRLPFIWRPAPSAGVAPVHVSEPVQQIDLAPTFCEIAGVPVPNWIQGAPLPTAPGSGRERALCEWDSQFPNYGMHLRTIYRNGWLCTVYEPSTIGQMNGLERFFPDGGPTSSVAYKGTEGELYNVEEDPHQFENRWGDPACASLKSDLVADLYDSLPARREPPLSVAAPV